VTQLIDTALTNYEKSLIQLETIFFKKQPRRKNKKSNQQQEIAAAAALESYILTTLRFRDELEKAIDSENEIEIEHHRLVEISKLDKRFRKISKWVTRFLDLEKWRRLYKINNKEQWWWYFTHPWDQLEWLWNFLIGVCLVLILGIFVDFIPRFWAGGPSGLGAISIVAPVLLTWFLGKDVSERVLWLQSRLDGILDKNKIPIAKPYRREVVVLIILGLTIGVWCAQGFKKQIADQYYCWATSQLLEDDNEQSSRKKCNISGGSKSNKQSNLMAQAEGNLKRAIAFNPDHAEAHFELAFLYERRQELEEARKEYKLAMQSGSNLAGIQLAKLYLMEEKKESANTAVAILFERYDEIFQSKSENLRQIKEDQRNWYIALGEARLRQEQYQDADNYLQAALDIHKKLEAEKLELPKTIYCLLGETLDKRSKEEKNPKTKEEYGEIAYSYWEECSKYNSPGDPKQDIWLIKANKRLQETDIK
jgi:Tetratricopeptide repeat